MKRQKAFSLLQLLIEVVIALFIAGIVVPSLVRSDLATKEALAVGSLHTINIIAGVVLSYTNQNIELAILGGLVGAMAAFAIPFPVSASKTTTLTRTATAWRPL
jgi:type II secretory pathway pseudopilin PulG